MGAKAAHMVRAQSTKEQSSDRLTQGHPLKNASRGVMNYSDYCTVLGLNGVRPPLRIPRLRHVCPRRQFRITRVASLGVFVRASSIRTHGMATVRDKNVEL